MRDETCPPCLRFHDTLLVAFPTHTWRGYLQYHGPGAFEEIDTDYHQHACNDAEHGSEMSRFCCIIRADSAEQRSLTGTRRSHARRCLDFTTMHTPIRLSTREYGADPSSQRCWRRCCFICVTAVVT